MKYFALVLGLALAGPLSAEDTPKSPSSIGKEAAVQRHLADGEELTLTPKQLIDHGRLLFNANWTDQDGGGRPLSKGNGRALVDPSAPLTGKRSFNRISAPDAGSCFACHNLPNGRSGGGGDFAASVFVLGQRLDFASFDPNDKIPTKGGLDEEGRPLSLQTVGNLRASTGIFGSGYLEMLAREMTSELQAIRNRISLGESAPLISKGVSFGTLTRRADSSWDVSKVKGLPRLSLITPTPLDPPTLILRPWHQAGNVVSLREFTNNALNHHHGIQPTERFGQDTDLDGDGFRNEMTRADLTAISFYQAALAVPGRVIPKDPAIEAAVWQGEQLFEKIGCARCHMPALPLSKNGWIYSEPNPFNPPTNLRPGDADPVHLDLTLDSLPQPRLTPIVGADILVVPAYTDMKLHDISDPADTADAEPLDMNWFVWSPKFSGGNRHFLTKRLWGAANEPPYFHHGLFTTLRQAVLAHHGEAKPERENFEKLSEYERNSVIEFLKTLQVLPEGTRSLVVDEKFQPRSWPPTNTP
jgi:hypothetical protein